MNFSKYAAALALFATAAYAADDNKTKKEEAPEEVVEPFKTTGAELLKAYQECKKIESNNTEELMINCMTSETNKMPKEIAAKAYADLKALEGDKLNEKAAQAVIDAVNKERTKKEGNWYDSINNVYGYVGGAVLLLAIGGGIYMAVGRKSEEADL